MKIVRVETHLLTADWGAVDPYWDGGPQKSTALVRVVTDDGESGVGESLLGYFLPEAVGTFVDYFAPLLVGEDPRDTEKLWQRMFKSSFYWGRKGAGLAVLSAIDIALWDLKAQAAGVPLYRLLGGLARDRILAYASGGGSRQTAALVLDRALDLHRQELLAAAEERELDGERVGDHVATLASDELGCGACGAAGREEIVDDDHA